MGAAGRRAAAHTGMGNDAPAGTGLGCSAAAASSSRMGRPAPDGRAAFGATSALGRSRARAVPAAPCFPDLAAGPFGVGRAAIALGRTFAHARGTHARSAPARPAGVDSSAPRAAGRARVPSAVGDSPARGGRVVVEQRGQ
jgi:hypothetical protein